MAWGGTVEDSRKITQRVRMVKEVMTLTDGSTGTFIGAYRRNNVVTAEIWVGLQGSVAIDYFGSHAGDGTIEDLSAERANDAGAYTLRQETIAYGTWY